MKIGNIINGVNFKRFCNVVIDVDTVNDSRSYNDGDIVFCKTDLLHHFFDEISNFGGKLKLISHQSDYPVGPMLWNYKPDCVKKWFAQNVNYQHPDLIPIPIGIENHAGPSKGSCIDISFVEENLPLINWNQEKKIYCNFADTHPNRDNVRNLLKDSPKVFLAQKHLSSADYHREMGKYKFVASPRGNGIDCHRTWEALLVGSIPIVERHFMYDSYPTLPIVQIDSWNEVLEDGFLESQAKILLKKELDLSLLWMPYWKNRIVYGVD